MDPTPDDLRERFLAYIEELEDAEDPADAEDEQPDPGLVLWRMVVTDPWYEHLLKRYAPAIVRKRGGLPQEIKEVKQHARLLLQQKFAKNTTLNADRRRVRETFARWMRRIAYTTLCNAADEILDHTTLVDQEQLEAGRRLRPSSGPHNWVNFQRALMQLPESQRVVLVLKGDGKKLKAIAECMHMSERQVKYLLKVARKKMKRLLPPQSDAGDSDSSG